MKGLGGHGEGAGGARRPQGRRPEPRDLGREPRGLHRLRRRDYRREDHRAENQGRAHRAGQRLWRGGQARRDAALSRSISRPDVPARRRSRSRRRHEAVHAEQGPEPQAADAADLATFKNNLEHHGPKAAIAHLKAQGYRHKQPGVTDGGGRSTEFVPNASAGAPEARALPRGPCSPSQAAAPSRSTPTRQASAPASSARRPATGGTQRRSAAGGSPAGDGFVSDFGQQSRGNESLMGLIARPQGAGRGGEEAARPELRRRARTRRAASPSPSIAAQFGSLRGPRTRGRPA